MRTTLNLDDRVLREAMAHAEGRSKTEVVKEALCQFARARRRKALLQLCGRVRWEDDVDTLQDGGERSRRPLREGRFLRTIVRASHRAVVLSSRMTKRTSRFPPGWNDERAEEILCHYETQSEEEAVAEDEAVFEDPTQTVMVAPTDLVPAIRALIAWHENQDESAGDT